MTEPSSNPAATHRFTWLAGVVPSILAIAFHWPSAHGGLAGDARFLIEENPWVRSWRYLPAALTHDYFWSPAGESIGYWRPLTKASWVAEWVLGGGQVWCFHAVQIAWVALAAWGVYLLGRELGLSSGWAAAAGAIFGLHPALVEPVSLVMARSDTVCVTGMIWAVYGWLRWRRSGQAWLAVHVLAAIFALASKEVSIVLVPLFVVWGVVDARATAGAPLHQRLLRGLRWALPVVALAASYFVARRVLLGHVVGATPSISILRLLAGGGMYLAGLVPFGLDTGVRSFSYEEAASWAAVLRGTIAWGVVGASAVISLRQRRWAELALLGWGVSAFALVLSFDEMRVPWATHKIAMADRWLAPAVAPAVLLAALALQRVVPRRLEAILAALGGAWAAAAIALSPAIHVAYADDLGQLTLEDERFQSTPPQFRSADDVCRNLDRAVIRADLQGDGAGVRQSYAAFRKGPGCKNPLADLTMLRILVEQGDLSEALPLAQTLSEAPPTGRFRNDAAALITRVLVANRELDRAGQFLANERTAGLDACEASALEATVLAAAARHPEAASRFEAALSCLKAHAEPSPELLLSAAVEYASAGKAEDARRIAEALSKRQLPPPLQERLDALRSTLASLHEGLH